MGVLRSIWHQNAASGEFFDGSCYSFFTAAAFWCQDSSKDSHYIKSESLSDKKGSVRNWSHEDRPCSMFIHQIKSFLFMISKNLPEILFVSRQMVYESSSFNNMFRHIANATIWSILFCTYSLPRRFFKAPKKGFQGECLRLTP